MTSGGTTLGQVSITGQADSSATLSRDSVTSGGTFTLSGMHDKYMVLRTENQGDRIGRFVANGTDGKVSFTIKTDRTRLVLWVFPTANLTRAGGTYECHYEKNSLGYWGIGHNLHGRYGVTIGKYTGGTVAYDGKCYYPQDVPAKLIASDGPDEPVQKAVDIINDGLDLGTLTLGSLVYTGAPNAGMLISGYAHMESQTRNDECNGWEGLHQNGKFFVVHDRYLARQASINSAWLTLESEGKEAWTDAQNDCSSPGGTVQGWQHYFDQPSYAQNAYSPSGKDLIRFAALMAPVD